MRARMAKLSALMLGAVPAVSMTVALPARAEISGLTVRSAKDIGPFRGKPYREIEAQMQGTAPGGAYSVPVTIAYPIRAADHNGFVIVDVLNTVRVVDPKVPPPKVPRPLARITIGEDFLFGRGNEYVTVLWDKHATEVLGNGAIATASDGYTILRDTAVLARNPAKYVAAEAGGNSTSGKVIAFGYSQTGEV